MSDSFSNGPDSFNDGSGQDTSSGPDQYTETRRQGWGQRLLGSVVAMVFGLILLPVSIGLLYWNEGRAVDAIRALDRGMGQVMEASGTSVDPGKEGKPVHVSGMMRPATPARDPAFSVTGADLPRLKRTVEMYQWKEDSTSHSRESMGGAKTTETTCSYHRVWSEEPIDSARFKVSNGHHNPVMPGRSQTFEAGSARLGAYRVDTSVLRNVSAFAPLHPPGAARAGFQVTGEGLYRGLDPNQPATGDVRVRFSAVTAQTVSVAAAQAGGTLTEWRDASGYTIALTAPGVVSAAALFEHEKNAEAILTWVLRAVGFAVMAIGFLCLTAPLQTLFAVIPFLESLVGAGLFLVAVTLAIPVTLLTIGVAWIAHRPLIGGALLAGAAGAWFLLRRMRPRRVVAPVPAGWG